MATVILVASPRATADSSIAPIAQSQVLLTPWRRTKRLQTATDNMATTKTVPNISDGAVGPAPSVYLDLNHWLALDGYLTLVGQGGGRRRRWPQLLHRGKQILRERLPTEWRHAIRPWLSGVNEQAAGHALLSDIDWSRTRLYSDRAFEGASTVWVNRQGREPFGIVPLGEPAERLLAEFCERIRTIRDPRG